ncbi:hypothetical protein [Streptomyces goshikiensis]|uniref:hypothetical protein n=1 Tax=Streptomyces goshikiensis TaxID=1942 RepID=UPI0036B576DD
MSSGPETIHTAVLEWSPELAAHLGLAALRRAAFDGLARGAHCSLNEPGDVTIKIERTERTERGGMVRAGVSAQCKDPLCADLLDAGPPPAAGGPAA